MKFTFFKRQRALLPISKMENREFNTLWRTELAKLQNLSLGTLSKSLRRPLLRRSWMRSPGESTSP